MKHMDAIKLRRARDLVLRYVYEHGAGSSNFDVPGDQIEQALGLSGDDLVTVAILLHDQGLLASDGQVGCIGLSHTGQTEAERLRPGVLMRDSPTPNTQQIYVRSATNSTIQIAGPNSEQHATNTITDLHHLLDEIERRLEMADLREVHRKEAADLIAALRKPVKPTVGKPVAAALGAIVAPCASELAKRLLAWFGNS
jgi:hypothetical protein